MLPTNEKNCTKTINDKKEHIDLNSRIWEALILIKQSLNK